MEGLHTPTWHFPTDLPTDSARSEGDQNPEDTQHAGDSGATSESPKRHYPDRLCRICLESVPPTYVPPSEHVPGFLQRGPQVVYLSEDPELGRLLKPCKCKGSSRYVHEGCLQTWRLSSHDNARFYNCPTCGFRYRLERLTWSRWINSTLSQVALTTLVLMLTIFLLGFIADPIINFYIDPVETVYYGDFWEGSSLAGTKKPTWVEHFLKGMTSLGLLGFIQALWGLAPWYSVRSSAIARGRGNTGRDRMSSIRWLVVVIGIASFFWAVYKGVRAWSRLALDKASGRVIDVPSPDDEEEIDAAKETRPNPE
ncbi:E3 ubiquitin-protein ligase MARCH [Aspergillus mulundensis]|uniref:RING-CH-type domain-containing protein n=1 Tax=Aspergillus mulundensis TaxID=1810919 RepID=A0A3D8SBG8_9EURO|nr:Uncharacterized protein DSM5745_04028 [Aspergillus mulundensis]RDW83702.1 Uncharacterized protein DSM5745_04028 [Aspergillus mulundensis]